MGHMKFNSLQKWKYLISLSTNYSPALFCPCGDTEGGIGMFGKGFMLASMSVM